MFKKNANNEISNLIEQWGSIIHNDLYRLHEDNLNRTRSKKEKELLGRLQGLKTSMSLDSCSGLLYIYQDKLYRNPCDINLDDIDDETKELPIIKAIDVEYLINFIDDIINKG